MLFRHFAFCGDDDLSSRGHLQHAPKAPPMKHGSNLVFFSEMG